MRIKSYSLAMESNYELERRQTIKRVRLPSNFEPEKINPEKAPTNQILQDTLKLSPQAQKTLNNCIEKNKTLTPDIQEDLSTTKESLLESILYWLFGIKINKIDLQENGLQTTELNFSFKFSLNKQQIAEMVQNTGSQWNYVSFQEKEQLSFSTAGTIETVDGRKFQFSTQFNIEQEVVGEYLQKMDPLVINFSGKAAEFSDNYYKFDLNSDGREEEIAALQDGSGFLALDANQDGKINNGKELFGPTSGNGFKDLSLFDVDRNGWIDEGDIVFGQLRIWAKDSNGLDQLFTLAEKGIGAIYLNSVIAPYKMQNGDTTAAVCRRAGIYLKENGTAGTVQQIDLVVK